MVSHGGTWHDSRQKIHLSVHQQGSAGNSEEVGPQPVKGVQERPHRGSQEAALPGARNDAKPRVRWGGPGPGFEPGR